MNRVAIAIKNRLSLRSPQADSLNIQTELTDRFTLKKPTQILSKEGILKGVYSEDGEL